MKKYKIVLLGEGRVGKTSILIRFIKSIFDDKLKSLTTIFNFFSKPLQVAYLEKTIVIEDKKVKLVIYDTAGQERFHSLAPLYYRDSQGIILVYDITDENSFGKVEKWMKEIHKFCNVDLPCIIVAGNKLDLHTKRRVEKKMAENFAKEKKLMFLEVSAKSNKNVDQLFLMLAKSLMKKNERKKKSSSLGDELYSSIKVPSKNGLIIEDEDGDDRKEKNGCC